MGISHFLIPYLIVVNIAAFVMMGTDKRRAVKHEWRIPEAALFVSAAIGGAAGSLFGMAVFRHKTQKTKFLIGMPLLLIIWVTVLKRVI